MKNPTMPLVTVAIAAYNAGEYLRPSVESVLAQTYDNLEVVVVDDGSTDGSPGTIADLLGDTRLRLLRQENGGKAVALNRILDEATGEYYAIHDADDLSHPDRIRRQVDVLEARPELGGCFCRNDLLIDAEHVGARCVGASAAACADLIGRMKLPAHDPTVMFRMSMCGDLRYDPELRVGQGFDVILQAGERHPFVVLSDCLYSYRMDDEASTSRRSLERTADYLARVREKAAERRGTDVPVGATLRGGRPATSTVTGHLLQVTIDQRLVGRRGDAVRTAWAALKRRDGLLSLKPLGWALLPARVLARKRPEFADTELLAEQLV